jgi:hypothetical protein
LIASAFLNDIDNKQCVDRLYSSSSSFHMPVSSSCTPSKVTQHNSVTNSEQLKPDSKAVESSVSDALQIVRLSADVPDFVQKMAKEHWRMVLLLLGLNKGVSSLKWQEAEHVLQLLVFCSAGQIETSKFDESLLVEKLGQGLRLLRISTADEEQFINAFKNHLSGKVTPLRPSFRKNAIESGARIEIEATVSPLGENILNAGDLNEIAQLINGEPVNDDYAENEEKAQLLDCLSSVDGLSACSSVKMLIKGKLHDCVLTKSGAQGDVFVITNSCSNTSTRKIAITRSRLGLPISLRRSEIILSQGTSKPAACNVTVFERKS